MSARARVWTRSHWRLVIAFAVLVSLAGLALAQQKSKEARSYDKLQQEEIQALVKAVDEVAAGTPAPTDLQVGWQHHFIKASDQKTFVPFRLTIDQAALATPSVSVYMRAVRRAATSAAAATTAAAGGAAGDRQPAREAAFEDVHFPDLRAEPGKPFVLARAVSVPAGEYDLYVAIKERPRSDKRAAPAGPAKLAVLKQTLSVPDFWNGELATSSIFVAERVEPITQPLTETELAVRPYAFLRSLEIVPAVSMRLSKKTNLSVIFQVYNAALDSGRKPNVTVEYGFHRKIDGAEKFFNRTDAQVFSAATLQPEFDGTVHQIPGGQEIPLISFPEGEYRLEITVDDKIAGKTLTRQVTFVVIP